MGLLAGRAAAAPAASGVATTVLGAMGTHPKNAGVQLAGCHALWSLAYKVRAQTNPDLCRGLAVRVLSFKLRLRRYRTSDIKATHIPSCG